MHCAFAMMIGATGFQVCRNGFAKGFWACWPFLVAWVTIVTANHYWVDAVLGWGVALTSAVVAHRLALRHILSIRQPPPHDAAAIHQLAVEARRIARMYATDVRADRASRAVQIGAVREVVVAILLLDNRRVRPIRRQQWR
jgi:hypothetical protein